MESTEHREPWNKGKLIGQKPPLKPKDIWAIRIQLQNGGRAAASFYREDRHNLQGYGWDTRSRPVTLGDEKIRGLENTRYAYEKQAGSRIRILLTTNSNVGPPRRTRMKTMYFGRIDRSRLDTPLDANYSANTLKESAN